MLGMGRLGSFAGNSSGDLFLAFSTANAGAAKPDGTPSLVMLPNDRIDPLFQATIEATEEAVVNAMLAAQTMTGADGIRVLWLARRSRRRSVEEVQPDEVSGDLGLHALQLLPVFQTRQVGSDTR